MPKKETPLKHTALRRIGIQKNQHHLNVKNVLPADVVDVKIFMKTVKGLGKVLIVQPI